MRKRDWLLIAVGDRIEPIQLQKTLFKFAHEANAPDDEVYTFEPYNWGPCSFEIYDDLATLREEDLLRSESSGRGWNAYRLTDKGRALSEKLREGGNQGLLKQLDQARTYVITRSFDKLLDDVYKDYPEFAVRSLFKS